jgi:hypothetical protein
MKTAHFLAAAALCGLVLSFTTSANAQSRTGYATIVHIQGPARYSPDNGTTWHPLTVGQTLGAGAVIQSGPDSTVDVALGDKISKHIAQEPPKALPAVGTSAVGLPTYTPTYNVIAAPNVIRMYADTVLAVDKLQTSDTGADTLTDTELDLRQGTIFGTVKKLSSASQFVVKMPNAAAAVRGTTFVLSATGVISVTDGSCVISVKNASGQTVTQVVDAGEKFDPATGQVTKLTPAEIATAEQTAVQVVTVVEGIVSFVNDETTVYVSPTTGLAGGDNGHPAWPF